jgi:predicted MPP superfamily phosphohydrolase
MSTRRIIWLTDVHFNFVDVDRVDALLDEINSQQPEAVLLGGDIAESHDVVDWLLRMDERLACPLFFVLGNHDFYHGSIAGVRQAVQQFCSNRSKSTYLTEAGVCPLGTRTAIIGHDGWSDAREGDFEKSTVVLNDYLLIQELRGISREQRREKLMQLGDEAAEHIRRRLHEALAQYSKVILLTHVPPMRQACWYAGRTADDNWAPHFTGAAVGQVIMATMPEFPDRKLTVLCGHTHNEGVVRPLPNVEIITGEAEYEQPRICRMFEVE